METETVPHSISRSHGLLVRQESVLEEDRENDDPFILLKIVFCKKIFNRHTIGGPRVLASRPISTLCLIRVDLGCIKEIRSPYRRFVRRHIANLISSRDGVLIDIPKELRIKAVRKLFQAIDKAVHPERPIQCLIHNFTVRTWDADASRINFVPATSDSIEGLERLRLQVLGGEECAMCLEEYDQPTVLVTRLPYSHYFHGNCITLWLHTHHTCPLCRFALPQEQP